MRSSPRIGKALARATDPLMWAWCWLAFRLVLVLPIHWRVWLWLLPFAGFYAYHVPGVTPWRWSEANPATPSVDDGSARAATKSCA